MTTFSNFYDIPKQECLTLNGLGLIISFVHDDGPYAEVILYANVLSLWQQSIEGSPSVMMMVKGRKGEPWFIKCRTEQLQAQIFAAILEKVTTALNE